ncbi:MAG: MerR family transcriptional regulator [Pseudomonadota bacterium]
MDKSPDAFRTISEVAEWLGVQTHVLRFWESKFTQVKPVKRAGGRRYYRPTDMALLGGIRKLLHDDGITIKGVQKILREDGIAHVAAFSKPLDVTADMAEQDVAENVVRFNARSEDVASAEVGSAEPADPAVKETDVADNDSAAEDDAGGDAPAQNLPTFLTQPMDGSSETPKPRVIDAPDPPPEEQITAEPGALSQAVGLSRIDPETARALTPLVARLAALRDRLAGASP